MANRRRRNNNNNQENDIMNPENVSQNTKRIAEQLGKLAKSVTKFLAKVVKTIVKLLVKTGPLGIVLLIVLIIAVIYVAYLHIPGMMKDKLSSLIRIDPSQWLANGAVSSLDTDFQDIIDVANYLEEMDYSLIGDGFVRPKLSDSFAYDETGQIINPTTNNQETNNSATNNSVTTEYVDKYGIIRTIDNSSGESVANPNGKVTRIDSNDLRLYRVIRSYLLSNYRIYTLKNDDETALKNIYGAMNTIGGHEDAWAKGLMKLYLAKNGKATDHWWWGTEILGNKVSIDGSKLSLKKGFFNNPMEFNIEGWAPRYGMSLEFLLSLHLGTNSPDLAMAMLQCFDTEVQVYLDDSGSASVDARYVDPNKIVEKSQGASIDKIKQALKDAGDNFAANVVNGWMLDKENCQHLLLDEDLHLQSPDNCTHTASLYKVEENTVDNGGGDTFSWRLVKSDYEGIGLIFDEYSDSTRTSDGQAKFGPEQLTNSLGRKVSDNYCEKLSEAQSLGFNGNIVPQIENLDSVLISDNDMVFGDDNVGYDIDFLSLHKDGAYQITTGDSTTDVGTVYRIRKVKIDNSWYNTPSGETESVQYRWVSYKYEIYKIGTYTQNASSIEAMDGGITQINSWEEPVITNIPEEFVDTVLVEFVIRDKTKNELIGDGYQFDQNGNLIGTSGRCSEDTTLNKCCSNCQKYVKAVVAALADVSDKSYQTYTPYIARVVGSWFRDTYFIIPEDIDDAIEEYSGKIVGQEYTDSNGIQTETVVSTLHPEFEVNNAFGTDAKYVKVDEEYLGDSGEYWSLYEMKKDSDGNDTDEYELYVLNGDGTVSDTTLDDFLSKGYTFGSVTVNPEQYKTKEEAEEDGWAFVKKAVMGDYSTLNTSIDHGNLDSSIIWSAYSFDSNGSTSDWTKATRSDDTDGKNSINTLYDIIYAGGRNEADEDSGIFYQLSKTNNVTQVEDAQRGPTNALIKYLFKYRKFYLYDGSEERALMIEHDKQRVLYGYNSYMNKYPDGYYIDKELADESLVKEDYLNSGYILKNLGGGTFYSYAGLLYNVLQEYSPGNEWIEPVALLLNNYGRSALRQSYSEWTDGQKIFEADIVKTKDTEHEIITTEEDLAMQWLDWQLDMFYMDKYGVDLMDYYNIQPGTTIGSGNNKYTINSVDDLLKLTFDPRDPDLIGTVQITKSSLSVFSILESTNTIDAEYAYRDIKELVVELDYFDREELSEKIPTIFTWILPDYSSIGWPVRPYDKANVDYGALIHSKDTYKALDDYIGRENSDSGENSDTTTTPETTTSGDGGDGSVNKDSSKLGRFEGYEDGKDVVSPVTGRVVETGQHERKNLYTGKMETVEYIILEVVKVPNDDEGLGLFYHEYEDICEGYTIMMDGFDVDVQDTGKYEANKVYALWNTDEKRRLEEIEQKKVDAKFKLEVDGETYIKEGTYIGKTISSGGGNTSSVSTTVNAPTVSASATDSTGTTTGTGDTSNEKLTYTYDDYTGPSDYIRIIIKDTDYAIVDNVEDFFDIPEEIVSDANSITGGLSSVELTPFNGDYSEQFLYWMLIILEGGFDDSYIENGYSIAHDIKDGTITLSMGVTRYCSEIFKNLGYGEYANFGVGDKVPLNVVKDVAIAYIDSQMSKLDNKYNECQKAALMSVMYNYGRVPQSLQNALDKGDPNEIKYTWEHLSDNQAEKYPGLPKRRKAETDLFFNGNWNDPYTGDPVNFNGSTPFTSYLNQYIK